MLLDWGSCASERLSENGADGLSQCGLIGRGQSAQFLEHKGRIDGGENRFEHGGLQQPGCPPVLDVDLTHRRCSRLLTGDGQNEEIWTGSMVCRTTNDDGGAAFDGGLIGEGKGYEDEIPEFITGHSRRRQDYPRLV